MLKKMSNLFNDRVFWAYVIAAVVVALVVGAIVYCGCGSEGDYCYDSLVKPGYTCGTCIHLLLLVLALVALVFAGGLGDYDARNRGKNTQFVHSLRVMFAAILGLLAVWYVLVFLVQNLKGALITAVFLGLFSGALMYLYGTFSGGATWIMAAFLLFALLALGWTWCLYNMNRDTPCVRNSCFC